MTGAIFLALLLAGVTAVLVIVAVDAVSTPDAPVHHQRSPLHESVLTVGHGPAVTTPAPDAQWLADWLGEEWVVAAARPAPGRIPVADRLPLTARCRWPKPTYSTTAEMEVLA